MVPFIKHHPFAVEAFFESSLVLTFAAPQAQVRTLLPDCLQPDTFGDKWAFVAAALVQARDLRPKGFPKIFGQDFYLIGYRVFVRYTNLAGKRLRGLYILKSETDKKKMEVLGNLFTTYRYATTDITQTTGPQTIRIRSEQSQLEVEIATGPGVAPLPLHSPFSSWQEARRFAGPLPFTFSYDAGRRQVLLVEGVRQNWTPRPVKVTGFDIAFLNTLQLSPLQLANAFIINNIPYYWKKGKTETWNG